MSETSHCHLCVETLPDAVAMLDHIRVVHPTIFEDVERWPDGRIVWHDLDPTIEDVIGGAA